MPFPDWTPATTPPELKESQFGMKTSDPVLVKLRSGKRCVAVFEHWSCGDDPQWYSDCSEHWFLDDQVVCWMELP